MKNSRWRSGHPSQLYKSPKVNLQGCALQAAGDRINYAISPKHAFALKQFVVAAFTAVVAAAAALTAQGAANWT